MQVMMSTIGGTYSRFIYRDCNNYIYLCNNTSLIECNEIIIVIDTNMQLYVSVQ